MYFKNHRPKKEKKVYYDSALHNYFKRIKNFEFKYTLKQYLIRYGSLCFMFMLCGVNILTILFAVVLWIILTMFFDHRLLYGFKSVIRIWFGVPGAGKTSVAAWLSDRDTKKGIRVLSNVEIDGAYKLDQEDLGQVDMSFGGQGCHVVYDEASIDFDNRNHSNFARSFARSLKPKYFSMHRHMTNMVDVFSQGYDIDKRIRDRTCSSGLFYLSRFPIKGFIFYRKIKKVFFIKKEDKEMLDGFEFTGLPRILYVRSVWNSFDTLDMSILGDLKQKDWKKWGEIEAE